MKALEIQELTGPSGIALVDRPEPESRPDQVLIEVVSVGISFPDLLQSQGLYQVRPDPPFVGGMEWSGIVRSAPAESGFAEGDRVVARGAGGCAELVATNHKNVFPLQDALSFDEGAALIVNYHTAVFSLGHRGRLAVGESVLILGAAGGVGTSGIQVSRGYGASKIIGLVSTEEKAEIARAAGADHTVLVSDHWKDDVLELTDGRGVDLVYDPVGGDRFLDGIRSLARFGRLVVVGFAAGEIPQVKVNRLLLRNVSVVGAAYGEAAASDPELPAVLQDELSSMIDTGVISPPIGQIVSLDDGAEAYRLLDDREAFAKVIVRVRPDPA